MTTHLSHEKRHRIMQNVGELIPYTSSSQIDDTLNVLFHPYASKFLALALPQIVHDPRILTSNDLFGYTQKELMRRTDEVYIPVHNIYAPLTDRNTRWNQGITYQQTDRSLIKFTLDKPIYLPEIHHFSRYGNTELFIKKNTLDPSGEILDILIEFAEKSNAYTAQLRIHNEMHQTIKRIVDIAVTTKQLTDYWPSLESFIPSEYLSKSIRQKKAKKLTIPPSITKEKINEINKEILIRKLLKR